MIKQKISVIDLGLKDYKETWDFQEALFNKIISIKVANRKREHQEKTPSYLLLVEHPPVYTIGKSGAISNLLLTKEELTKKGISFYKINRGGDITHHGPGQIVGYPILDLDNFFTDIHKYLRFLEQTIINTLASYSLEATRSKGETGVWFDIDTPFARKICAIGVRTSRWVTMHGFAFNVSNNLGFFDHIIPCGIRDKQVTSLQMELKKEVSMSKIKKEIVTHFSDIFQSECTMTSVNELNL